MMEKPILFNTNMVNEVLSDRKIHTRRVIKYNPYIIMINGVPYYENENENYEKKEIKCPYGEPGHELWVRETFMKITGFPKNTIVYKADDPDLKLYPEGKWKPSIFMPRQESRIQLKIKRIWIERIQDISPSDCFNEGVGCECGHKTCSFNVIVFKKLWDSINLKRGFGWKQNPFVWCIEFGRINEK